MGTDTSNSRSDDNETHHLHTVQPIPYTVQYIQPRRRAMCSALCIERQINADLGDERTPAGWQAHGSRSRHPGIWIAMSRREPSLLFTPYRLV